MEGKKGEQLGEGETTMIPAATRGPKRSCSLRDESENENQSPVTKDKRLRSENTECFTTKEVEVTSLNWPQSHQ